VQVVGTQAYKHSTRFASRSITYFADNIGTELSLEP
jgi:hypothetical protein